MNDLARTGRLVRIEEEIDPHLEAAEIQRRVYQAGGPAIYFARVKGCQFPMVSNLFGTLERTRFLFRDTLQAVQHLVELKIDPAAFWKNPWRYRDVLKVAWRLWPRWRSRGSVTECETTLSQLPQLVSWPNDGGPFITLPQVYTESTVKPGWQKSNLGMYRVQLAGNRYVPDRQVGLHYQIHRGIGVHHAEALAAGVPFRVNICVGGPPAWSLAAVMPLPEGLPEVIFAAALGGQPLRMVRRPGELPIPADADFCISGMVDPQTLPEGPFGDHLGYYSLVHEFPVLNVTRVRHRRDAIWPFTAVGRPPQEDTSFGEIIHEITGPAIPSVIAGVRAVHAVDAAGVHPLLLAIGSERYVPYAPRVVPQELLTQANAILGQGQLSLAKYLWIIAGEDQPALHIEDIPGFFQHVLQRVDWERDLHFQTRTTIDTLDYSGQGFNQGSKVVVAAVGAPRRTLPNEIPTGTTLPEGFSTPRVCLPGVLAVQAPKYQPPDPRAAGEAAALRFADEIAPENPLRQFPLIVLVDDAEFTSRTLNNWVWVTFTRSNPAADLYGVGAFQQQKHWGCTGPLVIDARIKPHHAPPLVEDPEVARRVERLAAAGGPLAGLF